MAILNVAAMLLLLLLPAKDVWVNAFAGSFWVWLGSTSAVVIPFIVFFAANCGHIYELLYRNTGYLVLSVPRTGAEILGGRMIAGFVEFVAYAIPAFLFLNLNINILASKASSQMLQFQDFFITLNVLELLKVVGIGTVYFAIIGSVISFAAIASASIIKKRKSRASFPFSPLSSYSAKSRTWAIGSTSALISSGAFQSTAIS